MSETEKVDLKCADNDVFEEFYVKTMKLIMEGQIEMPEMEDGDDSDFENSHTQPVTPRTLETLIRLSTSHAKARMSRFVQAEDAHAAIELIQYAYFKKVLEKEKKRRRREDDSDSEDDDDDDNSSQRPKRVRPTRSEAGDDSEEELATTQSSTRSTRSRRGAQNGSAVTEQASTVNGINGNASQESAMEVEDDSPKEISQNRLSSFKTTLCRAFQENRTQALSLSRVKEFVNKDNTTPYTQGEIDAAIEKMSDDNQVMMADGIIFLI